MIEGAGELAPGGRESASARDEYAMGHPK